MNPFKKKKVNINETVEKLIVGVFEVRLSAAKVEIETKDKTWKQVYAHPTRPYSELVALVAAKSKFAMSKESESEERVSAAIYNLVHALYGSTLFFYYPALCNTFIGMCNEIHAQAIAESDTKVEESNTEEAQDE